LCDLFYLPFEHGGQGLQLLHEFNWLKSNAQLVTHANCLKKNAAADQEVPNKPEVIRHARDIKAITVQSFIIIFFFF
jgi:protein O-GlcNAcase/histone acetyltransferase